MREVPHLPLSLPRHVLCLSAVMAASCMSAVSVDHVCALGLLLLQQLRGPVSRMCLQIAELLGLVVFWCDS